MFYTSTNLQGSQTIVKNVSDNLKFYTSTNLQGSQTALPNAGTNKLFYTSTNLQGSQTPYITQTLTDSFTPLQTYKVLKLLLRR